MDVPANDDNAFMPLEGAQPPAQFPLAFRSVPLISLLRTQRGKAASGELARAACRSPQTVVSELGTTPAIRSRSGTVMAPVVVNGGPGVHAGVAFR